MRALTATIILTELVQTTYLFLNNSQMWRTGDDTKITKASQNVCVCFFSRIFPLLNRVYIVHSWLWILRERTFTWYEGCRKKLQPFWYVFLARLIFVSWNSFCLFIGHAITHQNFDQIIGRRWKKFNKQWLRSRKWNFELHRAYASSARYTIIRFVSPKMWSRITILNQ